jgi:hypothetical protein
MRTTQASAPAHENAPPTPWRKRLTSSTTTSWPSANPMPVRLISDNPVSMVGRGPTRAASMPPGIDAISVPAA